MDTLSDVLDQELLQDLAGSVYYERGVQYFNQGRVASLAQSGDRITAEVQGTETYHVQLWLQQGELYSRCSCPLGVDGLVCKHCVAVGLEWIAEPPPYSPAGDAPAQSGTTMSDVRDYLAQQSPEALIELIMEQAMADARWRQRLLLKAASQRPDGADINTVRRTLRQSILPGGFVDYSEMRSYTAEVRAAIQGLDDLLAAGYAQEVVELCEAAIALIEDAYNSVDDSNGELGSISEDLQDLHFQACQQAQPNPQALAERLLRMELNSDYGAFSGALEQYADLLGDPGYKTYERLVDAELAKLPAPQAGEDFHLRFQRSELLRLKEKLVAKRGTVEDVVAVLASDLTEPANYLKIAQQYQAAGQIETAIAWAEAGLDRFRDHYLTGRLGEFLVSAYEQTDRLTDAVEIVWRDFTRYPGLKYYQDLKQQAEKAGPWEPWRDRALAHLRDTLAQQVMGPRGPHRIPTIGTSLLVNIFLWEGDGEQAWIEAQSGGCSQKLWMELADQRAADHPEDALAVYLPAIEPLIEQGKNDAYRRAVDLLVKVQPLMTHIDCADEFKQRLTNLATVYKRKRNFIKYLKAAGFQV